MVLSSPPEMLSFLHLPNYVLPPKILLKNHLFYKIIPDLSSFSIWIHAAIPIVTSLVSLLPPYSLCVCVYVGHRYVYTHREREREKREEKEHLYVLYLLSFSVSPRHCLSFIPGFATVPDFTRHCSRLPTNYLFI